MIQFEPTYMHYYKAFGLHIHSEIPLPELADGDAHAQADLLIREKAFALPEVHRTMIYRRGIQALFGQDTHALYLDWAGVAAFKAKGGNELLVSRATKDENLISLFTVSEALGLILFQRGYLLLHASSVAVGGRAWCFMGAPGAGKSTTAAAFVKAGSKLLSDDLTAITFDDSGKPFIVPAYPQLKIWDKTVSGLQYDPSALEPVSEGVNKFSFQPREGFPAEAVPLSKVLFLHHRASGFKERNLTAVEVPGEMVTNFPLPAELLTGDYLQKHFFQSLQCAQWAEILHKLRPDGFAHLEKWVQESIREHSITQ